MKSTCRDVIFHNMSAAAYLNISDLFLNQLMSLEQLSQGKAVLHIMCIYSLVGDD